MAELAFYRQKRFDGGIRMGIEYDGSRLFEDFQQGPPELEDEPMGSALEWYIDLRCRGDALPNHPEAARQWFEVRSAAIQDALREFSGAVKAGIDDDFPIESPLYKFDEHGVQMKIVCSVIKRITRRVFSGVLEECSREFPSYLQKLTTREPSPA